MEKSKSRHAVRSSFPHQQSNNQRVIAAFFYFCTLLGVYRRPISAQYFNLVRLKFVYVVLTPCFDSVNSATFLAMAV